MIYYSKSSNGFYDSEIHTVIPEDVLEIPVFYHQSLIDGQSAGMQITSNEEGFPVLIEQPKASDDELAASIRAQRDLELSKTDWVAFRAFEHGEKVPKDYSDYRQSLRDITTQSGFPTQVEWPTLHKDNENDK